MATTIVPPAADPSMAELRAMVAGTTTTAAPAAVTTETPEPGAEDATEQNLETATETVEPTPNPEEAELPKGVQKRIEKEVERAARAQSAIDRAVSDRKAKEAEVAKLTASEKGSEPVNQPKSQSGRPQRPQLGETGHENETWEQFQARDNAHDGQLADWIKTEAIREFQEAQTRETSQKAAKEAWDAAVTEHGKDFPAQVEAVRAVAPEGLQVAISRLDNWSGVAAYLGKNPAKLQELATLYAQNDTKAIATLGRIEAALPSKETKPATAGKPLPEPLKKVGGTASASGDDFQTSVEKGSMAQLRATFAKITKK